MIRDGERMDYGIYAPSPTEKLYEFASVIQGRRFLDLGSGRGEIVECALEMGADSYGVEINLDLYNESKCRDRIILGSMFDIELSNYDVLYYYLGGCKKEAELFEKIGKTFRGNTILYSG